MCGGCWSPAPPPTRASRRHHRAVPLAWRAGGVKVAPFKAQNMSNNSMVARRRRARSAGPSGCRRVAAGVEPEAAMNPVLLKPGSDRRSHVVVHGQAVGRARRGDVRDRSPRTCGGGVRRRLTTCAAALRRRGRRGRGQPGRDQPARRRLRQHGPGPARPACRSSSSATSTAAGSSRRCTAPWRCSSREDQALVARLRGQQVPRRRRPAGARSRRCSRRLTGRPVFGVLPWLPRLWLDSEDALDVAAWRGRPPAAVGGRCGRGRPVPADLATSPTSTRSPLEPGVDVTFDADAGRARRRRPGGAARHPRDGRRPGLAARARPRPTPPCAGAAGGRCSGSAAASRCWLARSSTTSSREPARVPGLGLLPASGGSRGQGGGSAGRRGVRRSCRHGLRDPPRGRDSRRRPPSRFSTDAGPARSGARPGTASSRRTPSAERSCGTSRRRRVPRLRGRARHGVRGPARAAHRPAGRRRRRAPRHRRPPAPDRARVRRPGCPSSLPEHRDGGAT